ncbi:MAG: hypothetical protein KH268_10055 [Clostridiales bacterium]|nr:hypothetical protein [Clostridiales bacterium]
MKKNAGRLSKKLFAAMMAGTLMTAMVGMTVSAEGVVSNEEGISSVNVQKIVTTDGNTYAPNTSFEFNVANGDAGTFSDGVNGNVSVKQGVTDGLKFGTVATFAPDTDESTASSYVGNATLTVDASEFDGPGVYHYVVTEEEGTYEGITYSEESYDVYVYVYNGTNGLYVGNVVSAQNGTKKDLTFTNDYGKDTDTTHDVIIKKSVTGNQGDKNEKFTFVVGVNGGAGEVYKVVTTIDGSATTRYVESGKTITVQNVTDSDTIHIYGLSANDKYTVSETEANQNGYTTTYSDTDVTTADGATVTTDGTEMTVTNNRDASTPTGIAMTYGPYALMVALAGGMAVLFLRRRNREEY